jgi:exopolyphosphatase/guanosine-5'-triphosphate,3'-diphosphate pyrophosphatase
MTRTLAALNDFAQICQLYTPTVCRSVGTAALRQAVNAGPFLDEVQARTGLIVEVLSGEDEALLTASGVLAALDPVPDCSLIIDVGGGSTEFALLKQGRVLVQTSVPLGVVSLTESSLSPRHLLAMIRRHIDTVFSRLQSVDGVPPVSTWHPVATAGTATTLAALHLQMSSYDWRRVNNYRLPAGEVERLARHLRLLTVAEREALPGMEIGRGDLILPGIAILQAVLRRMSVPELIVSDFGLLEGALLSLDSSATVSDN